MNFFFASENFFTCENMKKKSFQLTARLQMNDGGLGEIQ